MAYHFEGTEPPGYSEPPDCISRQYRNPIVLAQEWRRMLDEGGCASRADLARQLGVSRARVTQVLRLLDLTPEVLDTIVALGDPLLNPIVTERGLRSILKRSAEEQKRALRGSLRSHRQVDMPSAQEADEARRALGLLF